MCVCRKHLTDTPIHLPMFSSLWMKTSNAYPRHFSPFKTSERWRFCKKKEDLKGKVHPKFKILYLAHVSGGIVCFRVFSLDFDGGEGFTQC